MATNLEFDATAYLNQHVFPVLLPGLDNMLRTAMTTEKINVSAKVFLPLLQKRKQFNPLDYLVEYLYRENPTQVGRHNVALCNIPFVQEEWKKNPRPPLPLSATLSEEEATIILQAGYRGYRVRCRQDVQIFRQWQRGFQKEIAAVKTIQKAWRDYRKLRDNDYRIVKENGDVVT